MIKNIIMDGNGIVYLAGIKGYYLMNGVKEKLEELSKKYKLFLLSDGSKSLQGKKEILKKLEVLDLFSDVSCEAETGQSKKYSNKAFTLALKKFKLNIDETIFISHDKRETDNARKAGLKSILTDDLRKVII